VRENGVTESIAEQAALALPDTFGCKVEHGSNIAMGELARAHFVEAAL
jgi:hypothetical protein